MKKTLFILMAALPLLFVSCDGKQNTDNPGTDVPGGETPGGSESPDKSSYLGINALDLGLSVEWADKNLGAKSPGDAGYYFMWGETQPKDNYAWAAYKYGDSESTLTKYNLTDGKTKLDLSDDPAHVLLGGKWRTPTAQEWLALKQACTWTWTKQDGSNGALATAPDGTIVFFPASGGKLGGSLQDAGKWGFFWTSSRIDDDPAKAWCFFVQSSGISYDSFKRYYGMPIRAVRDKE